MIKADTLYTFEEFEDLSGLEARGRKLCQRGGLRHLRLGNRGFVLGQDFIEYLEKRAREKERSDGSP